jgi:hypothetical protein
MSKTDKLKEALEVQANSLEPAQREFVMAQFEHYKWNEKRISELEGEIESGVVDPETGLRSLDMEGKVFRQRHQLVAEQGTLFSHIMRWIKNTAAGKSELEEFIDD